MANQTRERIRSIPSPRLPFWLRSVYLGRLNRQLKLHLLLAVLVLLLSLGIGASMISMQAHMLNTAFDERGVRTEGLITRTQTQHERSLAGTHTRYYIAYSYAVDGQGYHGQQEVSEALYKLGARTVQVQYLPDTPETSRIELRVDWDMLRLPFYCAVAAAAVLYVLLANLAIERRRTED